MKKLLIILMLCGAVFADVPIAMYNPNPVNITDESGNDIVFDLKDGAVLTAVDGAYIPYGGWMESLGANLDLQGDYTIIMWIKPVNNPNQSTQTIIFKMISGTDKMWIQKNTSGSLRFYANASTTWYDTLAILDRYSLIIIRKSNDKITFKLNNGSPEHENTSTVELNSPIDLYIGRNEYDGFYKGNIQNVRIYKRALNAAEEDNLYVAGRDAPIDAINTDDLALFLPLKPELKLVTTEIDGTNYMRFFGETSQQ